MTTFEIIVTVAIIAIVVLKILEFTGMATINARMKEGFRYLGTGEIQKGLSNAIYNSRN